MHLPLLLERGSAEVVPGPAARAARVSNRVGFTLYVRALVDAGIVGPVRIDHAAGFLEVAKHRKRPGAGDCKEIDAEPERRVPIPHLADEGQQPFEREVVVDEECSVRALAHRELDVANDLLAVQRVDDRQHRWPHRLELFSKFESVHDIPTAFRVCSRAPSRSGIRATLQPPIMPTLMGGNAG